MSYVKTLTINFSSKALRPGAFGDKMVYNVTY